MKYYIWVLGCAMNIADAERIDSVLSGLEYSKTNIQTEADLIIAVACSVRQSAVDRIYGKIHNWQKIKNQASLDQAKPDKKLLTTVLTGCVLEKDKRQLTEKFDLYFPITDLNKLPKLLEKQADYLPNKDYLEILPERKNNFQALVPIMNGCNNFCAYCAVPYVRGREKSRPFNEIIKECENLIKQGYKEITLVGQNVNSYQHDFIKLLNTIAKIPGDFWLRFMSPHPKDTTQKLIKLIAKHNNICNHVHLPIQAGSNKILKAMNRPYTREKYLNLVDYIYKTIPNAAVSTDVIVGFPGETKTDFEQTIDLFKKAKFSMAYISQYSPRPQTAAGQLTDDVAKNEKKKREQVLTKIIEQTALEFNQNYLNKKIKVLVTKKKNQDYFGLTEHAKNIKITFSKNIKLGEFYQVEVTKAEPWRLSGKT